MKKGHGVAGGLLARNIARSQSAMRALGICILKPGIEIERKRDVPLYHADENEPGVIVRELNGKIERGHMRNGIFLPVKE